MATSPEIINKAAEKSVFDTKSALAIGIDEIDRDGIARLVIALKHYIDDPEYAAVLDERAQKAQIDLSHVESWRFEEIVSGMALNKLREVVASSKTFLSKKLAQGVIDSPLGRYFNQDRGLTREELIGRYLTLTPEPAESIFDEQQQDAIKDYFRLAASRRVNPNRGDLRAQKALDPSNLAIKGQWREMARALKSFDADGRLDYETASHDVTLLGLVAEGNIYSANYRVWHMIYGMNEEEKDALVPYNFSMRAVGDVVSDEVDPRFYDDFVSFREIDYKDIIKNGLKYSPVQFAPDVVAFYEETGFMVCMFDMSQADPNDPDSPRKLSLADVVRDVMTGYDSEQIESARGLFYQTGCALESRYIIERSLGVKLSAYSLGDQIKIVQLLNRATPEQMEMILGFGNDMIVKVAQSLEFGDDLGEAILNIAEKKGHEYEAQQIFSLISSVRDNLSDWESKAWFAQKDGEYQGYFIGIKRAIEMRISQILSPVPDLMDGVSQDARYFHRDETVAETAQVDSIDKVIQGLKLLKLLTEKIALAESIPSSDRTPFVGDDFSAASTLVGQSKVRVMMRPHESNASEARVRWTVTITPEEQIAVFGKYLDLNKQGKPRNAKISLRLDLEKISKMLSLDLGTRMDFGSDMREYPDRLLAALVTAGVQHSLTKQGRDILHTDYHVRDTFSEDLSRPERFAGFAELMIENYVDQSRLKRGKLGKHATRLSVDPESLKTDVVYTGLFFDDDSVKQLLDLLPAKYAHVPRHLHATIKYRPSEGLAGFTPGEGHTVKVVGVVDDGHAQALIVESTAMGDVKHPHITISTANDENGKAIPPSYSNHAIKQAVQNGTVRWLETPIELSATSGYLDGKSREIVTSV